MKIQELFEAKDPAFAAHKTALAKVMKDWHRACCGLGWIPETSKYKAEYKEYGGEGPEQWARDTFYGVTHSLDAPENKNGALEYYVDWGSAERSPCASFLRSLLKKRNLQYKASVKTDSVVLKPTENTHA